MGSQRQRVGEKPAPGAGYGEGEWTEATQVRKLENSGCQEAAGGSAFEEEFLFSDGRDLGAVECGGKLLQRRG